MRPRRMPYEAITVAATKNRRMTYEASTATATKKTYDV
jgi:hypothetical protein